MDPLGVWELSLGSGVGMGSRFDASLGGQEGVGVAGAKGSSNPPPSKPHEKCRPQNFLN